MSPLPTHAVRRTSLRVAGHGTRAPASRAPAGGPGAWSLLGVVLSQTAAITAVLYFVGWVRASATAAHFGVDVSLLGHTTADYLLRSLNSAVVPLLALGVLELAALFAHRAFFRRLGAKASFRAAAVPVLAGVHRVAAVLVVAACAGLLLYDRVPAAVRPWLPVVLFAGAATCAYTSVVRPRVEPARPAGTTATADRLLSFTMVCLCGIAVVLTMSWYAQRVGHLAAAAAARGLADASHLVVYSSAKLAIGGPGVVVDSTTDPEQKYRHRYSGLRLIMRTGRDHLLVAPAEWRRGRDAVLFLKEGDGLRIEVVAR